MRVERANPWAEAVVHVFAHVEGGAQLAPSLWNPAWVAFTREHIGPTDGRTLAEDARVLGALLTTHAAQVSAQFVAWLFRSAARVEAARAREIVQLDETDVDAPDLLPMMRLLLKESAAPELARAAAELEMPHVASLPAPRYDERALARALEGLVDLAPALAEARVELLRPLGIRGRVMGERGARPTVWVGTPEPSLGVSLEHAAWQAAHECVVYEVTGARIQKFEDVEREAVRLLGGRAEAAGRGAEHARWLARFRVP
jgi:hypothetical protein